MKIYLNRRPVHGPWGGGNKVVTNLFESLTKLEHQVVFTLEENIDLIFCFDPRPNEFSEWYRHILNYKIAHPHTKIIQRVGDLGTHGKPELTNLVARAVDLSDYLIFPSEWAKEYLDYKGQNFSVIHNAPLNVFHKYKKNNNLNETLSVVTHHWSTNPKKGFKYYKLFDDYIGEHKDISFTFVGRMPKDCNFKNVNCVEATGDNDFLANLLSKHDIYLTASEEEAGANHVLEALAAGIPVIYHNNGGSILNYCSEYGLGYDNFEQMIACIQEIKNSYNKYKEKTMNYACTINDIIEEYIRVIEHVHG